MHASVEVVDDARIRDRTHDERDKEDDTEIRKWGRRQYFNRENFKKYKAKKSDDKTYPCRHRHHLERHRRFFGEVRKEFAWPILRSVVHISSLPTSGRSYGSR